MNCGRERMEGSWTWVPELGAKMAVKYSILCIEVKVWDRHVIDVVGGMITWERSGRDFEVR